MASEVSDSPPAQSHVHYFIPGIMGSALKYRGPGTYGEPIDDYVWGPNLWNNADILATAPDRLRSSQVESVAVLENMRIGPASYDVYGVLLNFLSSDSDCN